MVTPSTDLTGSFILVVDDVPANLDVLIEILEEEGFRISVATSGERALRVVSQTRPDLILLDVMMPGIDGYETCRMLKAHEKTAGIPVIFLTARDDPQAIRHGFEAGGADYVTKPFNKAEFGGIHLTGVTICSVHGVSSRWQALPGLGWRQAWFRTDADCLDYLEWLRWPDGFVCPSCGHEGGWRLGDGRFMCPACSTRSSVTAGTIFDRTRTPLTIWYTACWLFATGKDGISALSLKRVLEISSYQTAWAMLHRLRSVLVRPGRDLLSGTVQVDETYIGGAEPGLAGGRARGKKVLTGIAVEVHEPRGLGRCRMSPLADASAETLHAFVMDHVEPGSTIITDGWPAYQGLAQLGYEHDRRSQGAARARGDDPNKLLPAVHRVVSLAKRWLLGTHQGAADSTSHYLNEFVFRFNRRRSRSRGMVFYRVLELAVAHEPMRFQDLIASRRPRKLPPEPPKRRGHPTSLERPGANRPWRSAAEH